MKSIKHTSYSSNLFLIILALAFLGPVFNCGDLKPAKDYVLVIDTSASMLTPHPSDKTKSTFAALTGEIDNFLDVLEPRDAVHLYTFDEATDYIDSFQVKGDNADQVKADVVEAIGEIQPAGKWTFTKNMLHSIAGATSKLNKKSRQSVVLIFSDGKDDPPPGSKKSKQALSGIASLPDKAAAGSDEDSTFVHEFVSKENLMYYVSLSKLHNEFLDDSISSMAPNAESFDASGDIGGRLGEIKEKIQADVVDRYFYKNWLFLGLAFLGLLLAIFLIYLVVKLWRYRMRIRGYITYYEKGFSFDKHTIFLDEMNKMKVRLGRSPDADARVRNLESKDEIILKATGPLLEPQVKFGKLPDGFIHLGDADREVFYENMKFQWADFIFQYNWDNPNKEEEDDENYLG